MVEEWRTFEDSRDPFVGFAMGKALFHWSLPPHTHEQPVPYLASTSHFLWGQPQPPLASESGSTSSEAASSHSPQPD